MESQNCNICQSNDFDVVRMDRWNAPDKCLWYPVLTCVCRVCGHAYNNPTLSEAEVHSFYQNQKRESFQVSRGESKGLNAADVDHLTRLSGPGNGRSALEIGCYTGYLASRLDKAGWQVEGLEPNTVSAQKARELHNLTVHECLFEDFNTKHRYDLIFLGGVLEHVRDPTAFLLKINRLLADDGLVYIRVPNLDDLEYDTAAELFILEHLHNFSSAVMEMLMEKTGFTTMGTHVHRKFPRSFVTVGKKAHAVDNPQTFRVDNRHGTVKRAIEEYSARIAKHRDSLNQIFRGLSLENPEPRVAIYGVGDHTGLLLQHTLLGELNVTTLLDSNPSKQGSIAFGSSVHDPDTFDREQIDVVVISSRAFQEEIYQRIQHWENEGIRILRLYDLSGSRFVDE